METIYLVIIFLVPGLMHKSIKTALDIKVKKESKGTIYEQLYYIVINSIVVSTASVFMMKKLNWIGTLPQDLDELILEMKNFEFLGKFVVIATVTTLIWYVLCEKILKKISFYVKNKYYQKKYYLEFASQSGRTTWEEIIISQEKNNKKPLIAIYEGTELITAGFLDMFDRGDFSKTGIDLARTRKVMRLLKEDKEKEDADKLFGKILHEYVDMESGKRIIFFDNEKVYQHWDN